MTDGEDTVTDGEDTVTDDDGEGVRRLTAKTEITQN